MPISNEAKQLIQTKIDALRDDKKKLKAKELFFEQNSKHADKQKHSNKAKIGEIGNLIEILEEDLI